MLQDKVICILGAGSMGEAMIEGLLNKKLIPASQLSVVGRTEKRQKYLRDRYSISLSNKSDAIKNADIIIIAVKPKDITEALTDIKSFTNMNQLFISVVAGVSTDYISEILGYNAAIVRTMPNTSVTVGLSATGLAPGDYVNENQLLISMAIFASVGIVEVVAEHDLDAVTGLSGSGPAYVYYLVEAMQEAAEENGLKPDVARSLILQTIVGAAHMLMETGTEASELRRQVTSPNGTTEAGITKLEQYRFKEAIHQCIRTATNRSKQMGEIHLR